MAKVSKEIRSRIDSLDEEQLERKVTHLRETIPQLQEELEYASRLWRDKRKAALQRKIDDSK